jgi:DNA-binding transcriptional regulator YiaG
VAKAKTIEKKRTRLPAVIQRLKAWREANKLSQRQAVAVMQARECPITLSTLQAWERSWRSPGQLASKALVAFLSQYPTITDAPVYGRWRKKAGNE